MRIPSGTCSTSTNGSFNNQPSNTFVLGLEASWGGLRPAGSSLQPLANSHTTDSSLIRTVGAVGKCPIRKFRFTRKSNQERKIHSSTVCFVWNEMIEVISVHQAVFSWPVVLTQRQTNNEWMSLCCCVTGRTPQNVCGARLGQRLAYIHKLLTMGTLNPPTFSSNLPVNIDLTSACLQQITKEAGRGSVHEHRDGSVWTSLFMQRKEKLRWTDECLSR